MIEIKELRVGNLIYNDNKIIKVKDIKTDNISINNKSISEFTPILINKNILLNCGFEYNGEYYWRSVNGSSNLYLTENKYDKYYAGDWLFSVKGTTPTRISGFSTIISLHILQNLYYFLSGEELNINIDNI